MKVHLNISLTRSLSECILSLASKSFWHERIAVKSILIIAISVYASHLRKDILSDNRLIRRNYHARIALHQSADIIEFILHNISFHIQMIMQDSLHRCERSVSASLSQSVDRDMNAGSAFVYRSHGVAYSEVIVIMSVEVKTEIWEACRHLMKE